MQMFIFSPLKRLTFWKSRVFLIVFVDVKIIIKYVYGRFYRSFINRLETHRVSLKCAKKILSPKRRVQTKDLSFNLTTICTHTLRRCFLCSLRRPADGRVRFRNFARSRIKSTRSIYREFDYIYIYICIAPRLSPHSIFSSDKKNN